jgi:hypothetical protein
MANQWNWAYNCRYLYHRDLFVSWLNFGFHLWLFIKSYKWWYQYGHEDLPYCHIPITPRLVPLTSNLTRPDTPTKSVLCKLSAIRLLIFEDNVGWLLTESLYVKFLRLILNDCRWLSVLLSEMANDHRASYMRVV